ncbi:MAG TPA: transcriptional regulator GcvA [Alphaproteobacteria bacterium]|nr:transcriptional regulator GcvA [Alphaproteobacteria bacterium]
MDRMPPPPLIALRSFEAAARRSSFLAAADELGVTPAAVSHQVKRLEQHLGVRLFHRSHRAVTLTPAGAGLAESLRDVFDRLNAALARTMGEGGTRIEVSALPSLAAKWLAPRLHRFAARHPDFEVRVDATDALADFGRQPVDIALRYGAGDYPGLHAEWLASAEVAPVCSPVLAAGRLAEPADLLRHTLLHFDSGQGDDRHMTWASWFAAAGVAGPVPRGPVFNNFHLAQEAAAAGHGVALGLAGLVEADLAAGRLVRPFPIALPNRRAFWLVLPADWLRSPKLRAFVEWLRAERGDGPAGARRTSDPESARAD